MSNELQLAYGHTDKTLYAILHDNLGNVWQTTTNTLVPYITANLVNYVIDMAEQGSSGYYVTNFPSVPVGGYQVSVRMQSGGSPAESDQVVGAGSYDWTGTEINAGIPDINVVEINESSVAAVNLQQIYDAIEVGTAQGGGSNYITLRSGASSNDNEYQYQAVVISAGAGAGQTNRAMSYVGATKQLFVESDWVVQPDHTSVYAVLGRIG